MPAIRHRAALLFRPCQASAGPASATVMKCPSLLSGPVPSPFAVIPRSLRQSLLLPLIAVLTVGLGVLGYGLSERTGLASQAEAGSRQLELNARAVESELSRYTYLPSLLELDASVARLLADPEAGPREAVNLYLEGLQRRSASRAIYVLDMDGRVQASSNWRDNDSYLGEDLSFRPYFVDAVHGRPGRYYGLGTTTGEAGYYLAHGLRAHGRIVGVAVVKIRLDSLETRWQKAQLQAFVSDENGIIILASDPDLRLKSVQPLTDESRERLARSLQYYWFRLVELQPLKREVLDANSEKLTFAQQDGSGHVRNLRYLSQSRGLADTQWRFTLLTPLQDLRRESIVHGVLAGVAFALLAFLLIAWNERRKVLATRLAAREALEAANSQLEQRIAERTDHLRASNERLKAQIRERRQAEQTLREAQDQLVRAGKLAAIGQMSTSIAHELNQPLAALRTLSGNTVRFLERGALDVASTNLCTINDLVDRMGRITASLRAFARGADEGGQASIKLAVEAALRLLEPRLHEARVVIEQDLGEAWVAIDQTRLEQILVNLVGNALDAMLDTASPCLWLTADEDDGRYRLHVRDNGHGISAEARKHLFEPFYTTKPGERGLGLGLALSAGLAAAAGGELSAGTSTAPGATFTLALPLVPPHSRRDPK